MRSAWRSGFDCPWRENGVWGISPDGRPELLRPDHFTRVGGKTVGFNDYWEQFVRRFASPFKTTDPDAALFIEGSPNHPPPSLDAHPEQPAVFAPHWYDDLLLGKKRFYSFVGLDSRDADGGPGPSGGPAMLRGPACQPQAACVRAAHAHPAGGVRHPVRSERPPRLPHRELRGAGSRPGPQFPCCRGHPSLLRAVELHAGQHQRAGRPMEWGRLLHLQSGPEDGQSPGSRGSPLSSRRRG